MWVGLLDRGRDLLLLLVRGDGGLHGRRHHRGRRVQPVDHLLDGLEVAAGRLRLRLRRRRRRRRGRLLLLWPVIGRGGRGPVTVAVVVVVRSVVVAVVVPLRRRHGRLPRRRLLLLDGGGRGGGGGQRRRRLPGAVGGRLEVERRGRRRAAGRRAPARRDRLERGADRRRVVRVVQSQVVRVEPAQARGRSRGQAAGGHLERVAAGGAGAGDAAAGRGALQVRLREQRARVVRGERQLSVEQQVGGGAERGRAQRPAEARRARVHARVQVRQQVRRRRDRRPERHVR